MRGDLADVDDGIDQAETGATAAWLAPEGLRRAMEAGEYQGGVDEGGELTHER